MARLFLRSRNRDSFGIPKRHSHETSASPIFTSRSRRCRASRCRAPGLGANLSAAAGAYRGRLRDRHCQSFVVDNRPGAGTNTATEFVVNAPPDGYTLLMASTAAFTNAALYDNLRFNFVRDIAPVA